MLLSKNQKPKPFIIFWLLSLLLCTSPVSAQEIDDIIDPDESDMQVISSGKSKRKAVLLSLALPGLGEAYAGDWGRARTFFAIEGAIWGSFAAFRVYGSWRANDYRLFSADHAGVTLRNQPDTFFRDMGSFISSDVFNFQQNLTQRNQANLYTGDDTWAWDSDGSREAYLKIRRSSRRARVRSLYIVGVAVVNRLVSAIDARRTVDAYRDGPQLNLHTPPDGSVWMMATMRF